MHLINAQEIIDGCTNLLGSKRNNKTTSFEDLEKIQGCLIGLSKHIMEREEDICVNSENGSCKYSKSSIKTYIEPPYPEVMMFNINWFDNQVPYLDTLKFAVSIP